MANTGPTYYAFIRVCRRRSVRPIELCFYAVMLAVSYGRYRACYYVFIRGCMLRSVRPNELKHFLLVRNDFVGCLYGKYRDRALRVHSRMYAASREAY